MSFAAPLWLLALVPWGAAVLYLIWGRRRRVDVPFLELWPAHGDGVRVRRRATPPPVALALAILATLLALLAAGRPAVMSPGSGARVTVVLDRGLTMSARGDAAGGTRLSKIAADVATPLRERLSLRRFERWVVPGPGVERTDASDLPNGPATTPTALDTRSALDAAVRAALRDDVEREDSAAAGVVVLVSDHDPAVADDRLVRVVPEHDPRNVRIAMVAARESPAPQVMVRILSTAGIERTTLRVTSGPAAAERQIALPAGGVVDAFVDLPNLAQTVKAELIRDGDGVVDDDQPADDAVWLVREASWPRLEVRSAAAMLPAVRRMVEVYARQRAPSGASRTLAVVSAITGVRSAEPAVIVPPIDGSNDVAVRGDAFDVADHPVTRGVDFSDAGAKAQVSPDGPPAGYSAVVSIDGKVWVAVREQPIRSVWVGFDSDEWSRSTAFVMFWTNAFNWAGQGGERFASYPVGSLEEDVQWTPIELAKSPTSAAPAAKLWPGLYRRQSDGMLRALHAPDVPMAETAPTAEVAATAPATDWRERLERKLSEARGRVDLSPPLALAAVVCLVLSAGAWKRRSGARQAAEG